MRRFDSLEVRCERQLLVNVAIGRMADLGHHQPVISLSLEWLGSARRGHSMKRFRMSAVGIMQCSRRPKSLYLFLANSL